MKCYVPQCNIKILGRAFHALAKLGDYVFFDVQSDAMQVQAVSSSQSAYGLFRFTKDFFSTYDPGTGIKCKVALKSCFLAFKSATTLEKQVDECQFELSENGDSMIARFNCRYAVVKSFTFPFVDFEQLNTNFSKESYKNRLLAQSHMLFNGLQNFCPTVEQVTLIVDDTKVILKNYTEDEPDFTKVVHTELLLELDEFDEYAFEEKCEVTFGLKELKAVLAFAEGSNLPISIHFNKPGDPIMFTITSNQGFITDFVLATLSELVAGTAAQSEKTKVQVTKSNYLNQAESNSVEKEVANASQDSLMESFCENETKGQEGKNLNEQPSTSFLNYDNSLQSDDETMMQSSPPPAKKTCFKSYFLGFSRQTEFTSMLPTTDEVLAPASDEDE